MSSLARRTALALIASASLLGLAPDARADDKAACVSSSEKAQQLRNAGKLNEAREQLVICGRAECPKLIQADCTQWMREVLDIVPTVVPAAKDRRGRDIVDVKVSIDGKIVTEALDGKAITVDPGVHTFKWEARGAAPVEEQMVVRQGERNRLVTATIAIGEEAPKGGGAAGGGASGGGAGDERGLPVAAMIVGGIGLVGGGIATYMGLSADSNGRDLRDTCAPKCTDAQVQEVKDEQNTARIVGIASGVVVAAGVVLLVLHYTSKSSRSGMTPVPTLTMTPSAGGAATLFRF
jgi:hypothetical protein